METREICANLPPINFDRPDSVTWKLTANGRFSVSSAKEAISMYEGRKEWYQLLRGPAIVYMIWQERNSRLFNGARCTPGSISHIALNLVKDWLHSLSIEDSLAAVGLRRLWRVAW
ncbi:hypothetical protein BUALT_Bualt01G0143600 [Buddleja alternifolia]|uniref:Reverse transcriptase zinc-binding domain-containing protein n=1 Tax=Buddleja alternifolia TaxID=168488 RepID=A0AAV6Y732_9LAMI|nr:hypothetical protein BUALT_Bualt01G0143600 [Buddleja alternifolia]